MANDRKEVKLRLTVEAETRAAQDANKKLANELDGVKKKAQDAERSVKAMRAGGAAGAPAFDRGPMSKGSAFDRPVPVIIVGPKPLPVSGSGSRPGNGNQNLGDSKASNGPGLMAVAGNAAGIVGIVAGAVSTITGLSKAIADLDSPTISARDRFIGLAQAIPLVGNALGSLTNNVLSMIERIRNPALAREVAEMQRMQGQWLGISQIRFAGEQRIGPLQSETLDAQIRARGFEMVPGQAQFEKGLSAVVGAPVVEGTDRRMRDAQEEMRRAQREFEIADAQKEAQWQSMKRSEEARDRAEMDAKMATADAEEMLTRAGWGRDENQRTEKVEKKKLSFWDKTFGRQKGPEYEATYWNDDPANIKNKDNSLQIIHQNPAAKALLEEQRKIQQALQAQQSLEKEMMGNKQKMIELEKARYNLMQAETGVMKTRLALLQEEEAKARSGAQQFGAMDAVSQRALLDSLQRFKSGGREAVTEGELGALQSNELTRGLVAKRLETDVFNSSVGQEFLKETGARDLKVIEQERMKLESEVKMKIELDEEQYKKMLADGLKKANDDLVGIIKQINEIEIQKIRSDISNGRLNRQ